MKQFSLEEFKKNPERKVVTRRGKDVRIICTDAKGDYPVVGLIHYRDGDERESPNTYTENGSYDISNDEDARDLFFSPEKKIIWGNLYSTQLGTTFSGDFYKTEEAALKEKAKDFSKYITTFKVEWEE